MSKKTDVIVVGAGMAGLSCALTLQSAGLDVVVLEAGDRCGGRVQSDRLDGYILDRGFQIYLTAYPEGKRFLDYDKLNFKKFYPGAIVRKDGRFHRVADPLRSPKDIFATLTSPLGKPADKVKVACLQKQLQMESIEDIFDKPECTTYEVLRREGFSRQMIDDFFKPFLGVIFLERDLKTSSHVFEFVFKMLALGDNVLPEQGMQAIPDQLAARLKDGTIEYGQKVEAVKDGSVVLASGKKRSAKVIVLATEQTTALKLLHKEIQANYCSQTSLYFSSDEAPLKEPCLVLNGDGDGYVNNVVVLSNVSPAYAPPGKALTVVSCVGDPPVGDAELENLIRQEMEEWFGASVKGWKHLRTYRVRYSLPAQSPTARNSTFRSYQADENLYLCGDYLETGSINGALKSGRTVASKILSEIFAKVG